MTNAGLLEALQQISQRQAADLVEKCNQAGLKGWPCPAYTHIVRKASLNFFSIRAD